MFSSVKTTPPTIAIDTAAKALLDKATASYKRANSYQGYFATSEDGKERGESAIAFQRPNLLSIKKQNGCTLIDGANLHLTSGTKRNSSEWKSPVSDLFSHGGYSGADEQILNMLDGKSPLDVAQKFCQFTSMFGKSGLRADFLSTRLIDGETLQGVRLQFSMSSEIMSSKNFRDWRESTLWFGGPQFLLRRVQIRSKTSGQPGIYTLSQKVFDQQLNSQIAPDTFKLAADALKPAQSPQDK